ncbi:hypothetical protein CHI08_10615 [Peribacillus simplex]|nr:hypothetical protein CHI08_10615 [Peribacillus simplex]
MFFGDMIYLLFALLMPFYLRLVFSYSFDQRKGKMILYRKFVKIHMKNSSKRKECKTTALFFSFSPF